MNHYEYIANLTETLGPIPADTIVSRTLHQDTCIRLILFGFAPGQELSEHSTPMTATIQIISGDAEIALGGEHFTAVPGAQIYMPPKLPHSIRANAEPVIMLLTMVNCKEQAR